MDVVTTRPFALGFVSGMGVFLWALFLCTYWSSLCASVSWAVPVGSGFSGPEPRKLLMFSLDGCGPGAATFKLRHYPVARAISL